MRGQDNNWRRRCACLFSRGTGLQLPRTNPGLFDRSVNPRSPPAVTTVALAANAPSPQLVYRALPGYTTGLSAPRPLPREGFLFAGLPVAIAASCLHLGVSAR